MERPEKCDCPMLRLVAEAERMAACGIIPVDSNTAMERRVTAIAIGLLRDEHGCTGPRFNMCRYSHAKYDIDLTTDPNVPLLHRKIDDKQDHRYI